MKREELAKMIDHTLLGPTASEDAVKTLCDEAHANGFASVCINPCHVVLARELLADSPVKVCAVIGFPHGMNAASVKGMEAERAIADGADELDMVINVAALKEKAHRRVHEDIARVCDAARGARRKVEVKAILEVALLTEEEITFGAVLAKAAGADFVKTSTGFGPGGATTEAVSLMRQTVGADIGVKAAGGIRDYETAAAMIEAGATRIGASRSLAILEGAEE